MSADPFIAVPQRVYDKLVRGELKLSQFALLVLIAAKVDFRSGELTAMLDTLRLEFGWPWTVEKLRQDLQVLKSQRELELDVVRGGRIWVIRIVDAEGFRVGKQLRLTERRLMLLHAQPERPTDLQRESAPSLEVGANLQREGGSTLEVRDDRWRSRFGETRALDRESAGAGAGAVGGSTDADVPDKRADKPANQYIDPTDALAVLVATIRDADSGTEKTCRAEFANLPEAAFRTTLEQLRERRHQLPPLGSEAGWVRETLRGKVADGVYSIGARNVSEAGS
jgi:hypothetical protein